MENIKIDSKPFSTTEYFGGSITYKGKSLGFTLMVSEDTMEVSWCSEFKSNDRVELESKIKNKFNWLEL